MKRSGTAVAPIDAVEPVTTFDGSEAAWRIVGQEGALRPAEIVVGDVFTITPFSEATGGVMARLLNTCLIAVNDPVIAITEARTPALSEAVAPGVQNPVAAAKERWRARAIKESQLFGRMLAAPDTVDGVPAPPTSDDDGA